MKPRNIPRPGGTTLTRSELRTIELPRNVTYLPTDWTGFSHYKIRLSDFLPPPEGDEKPPAAS